MPTASEKFLSFKGRSEQAGSSLHPTVVRLGSGQTTLRLVPARLLLWELLASLKVHEAELPVRQSSAGARHSLHLDQELEL